MTMKPLDVSKDPADYIYGPTGNQTSRTNGGTNRSGGISVIEADEEPDIARTAEPKPVDQSTEPPAQPPAAPQQ